MSAAVSSVVAGMSTAPSFMQASMVSHSSTWLPSISSTRWPRSTPWARSHAASSVDRADICAKVTDSSEPSSPITRSAVRSAVPGVAATTSNQSRAQLNRAGRGGSYVASARS